MAVDGPANRWGGGGRRGITAVRTGSNGLRRAAGRVVPIPERRACLGAVGVGFEQPVPRRHRNLPTARTRADGAVFAGTEGAGIFGSTNGGSAWAAVNEGLTDLSVNWIAISPTYASDRTVVIATSDGVHRSTDGGETWQSVTDISALALAAF